VIYPPTGTKMDTVPYRAINKRRDRNVTSMIVLAVILVALVWIWNAWMSQK